jgi:VWFA-related protein
MMRGLRAFWLALALGACVTLPWLAAAQTSPTPPPPGSIPGVKPPAQQPPAQQPPVTNPPAPRQPGSTPSQGNTSTTPAPKRDPRALRGVDPFLRQAQNVQVRVTQMEIGDFPTVRAFVTVTDELGTLIRSLKEDSFTVKENGQDVGNLRFGNRNELNLPLAIEFVVDISSSMEAVADPEHNRTSLDLAKQAIHDFVGQLQPRDRVGLIVFADSAMRACELTTDHQLLLDRLDNQWPWGMTALWDGIYTGMDEVFTDADPARRAVIVLSDGMDNQSVEDVRSLQDWYEQNALAENRGFSIYAIGLGPEIDRGGLGGIATATGGLYLDSPGPDTLADLYQEILSQIQNEYLLEYDSTQNAQPGQIIDVSVDVFGAASSSPGKYTYRSPGLSAALARAIWPGMIAIAVAIVLLVIATIFKINRRVWLTMMLTPLEGKDYTIGERGLDIGASEVCALRLAHDPAILPLHASIKETHDGFILEAVDPDSPIIVDNRLLARKLLRSGDRFRLGHTAFVFHERIIRPGEGRELLAEHVTDIEPVEAITEDAQRSGQVAPATGRRVPAKLTAISGPHTGQSFTLAPGENVIGRKEGSIVLANDSQTSRRHCMLTLTDDSAQVLDAGSSNGTYVNGQRCQPGMAQPVWAGDTLRAGASEFRLE